VKLPSRRKLLFFGVFSLGYGCLAAIAVVAMSLRTCSMQPDVAVECNPTPTNLTALALTGVYVALAAIFFKRRISGVD
jgi:hypothetical protein